MVPRRNVNFTPHKKNWLNRENKRSLKIIGSAFSWFSFFLLLTLLLGNPVLATDYPPYRSFLGVHFQQGPGSRIIIDQVSPDSPATQAGLSSFRSLRPTRRSGPWRKSAHSSSSLGMRWPSWTSLRICVPGRPASPPMLG